MFNLNKEYYYILPKKQKKKEYAQKTFALKMENKSKTMAPFVYDGTPSIEIFQKWKFSVECWIKSNYIQKQNRLIRIQHYLSGNAFDFYYSKVIPRMSRFTLKKFFVKLFDWCFPPNFIIN